MWCAWRSRGSACWRIAWWMSRDGCSASGNSTLVRHSEEVRGIRDERRRTPMREGLELYGELRQDSVHLIPGRCGRPNVSSTIASYKLGGPNILNGRLPGWRSFLVCCRWLMSLKGD